MDQATSQQQDEQINAQELLLAPCFGNLSFFYDRRHDSRQRGARVANVLKKPTASGNITMLLLLLHHHISISYIHFGLDDSFIHSILIHSSRQYEWDCILKTIGIVMSNECFMVYRSDVGVLVGCPPLPRLHIVVP